MSSAWSMPRRRSPDYPSTPLHLHQRTCLPTALLVIDELGFEALTRDKTSRFLRLVTRCDGADSTLIAINQSAWD